MKRVFVPTCCGWIVESPPILSQDEHGCSDKFFELRHVLMDLVVRTAKLPIL